MTDIYHGGIKGQRWGIRRFQYANGTYTPEGNMRYRPNKNSRFARNVGATAVLGEMGLVAAKAMQNNATLPAINAMSGIKLSAISSSVINVGNAASKVIMAVPMPVKALALPTLAVGSVIAVANVIDNKEKIVEALKKSKDIAVRTAKNGAGAVACGAALSAIQQSPIPLISGVTVAIAASIIDVMNDEED